VIAQTGFGLVAALDWSTGEVRWRTEYTPIEFPKPKTYGLPKRQVVWRMAPPLVVQDVVLATPSDALDLLALDLADGHLLWNLSAKQLGLAGSDLRRRDFDHLIGVDADVLYFGGEQTAALRKPGGLRSNEPMELLWSHDSPPQPGTRAQMIGDSLFVNGPSECQVLDRRDGTVRSSFPVRSPLGLLAALRARARRAAPHRTLTRGQRPFVSRVRSRDYGRWLPPPLER
jgi:hypothetical protein